MVYRTDSGEARLVTEIYGRCDWGLWSSEEDGHLRGRSGDRIDVITPKGVKGDRNKFP